MSDKRVYDWWLIGSWSGSVLAGPFSSYQEADSARPDWRHKVTDIIRRPIKLRSVK
jgi:hypothetical protein